jgi:hypothetical protein
MKVQANMYFLRKQEAVVLITIKVI